jgi:hypothetical protein
MKNVICSKDIGLFLLTFGNFVFLILNQNGRFGMEACNQILRGTIKGYVDL